MLQGCVLSLILFNLHSEFLINDTLSKVNGVEINGMRIKPILFADDTAVVVTSSRDLHRIMDRIVREMQSEECEMSLCAKKI